MEKPTTQHVNELEAICNMNQPNPQRPIDFLIIGAQKSGTTSLFQYLNSHSNVYMPGKKEISFFSNGQLYSKGADWYFNRFFSGAKSNQIIGEASPQYMCYLNSCERIHSHNPNCKLIAILRDPVRRAYSHYRMSVRRNLETESFNSSIKKSIAKCGRPEYITDTNHDFVQFGEYGRVLSSYLRFFPKKQIKIVFLEELTRDPITIMKELFDFLGVDSSYKSSIIGKQFHVGGKKRIESLEKHVKFFLNKTKKFPFFGKYITPQKVDSLIFWLETEFNVKSVKKELIDFETDSCLTKHYVEDVKLLEDTFHVITPWKRFKEN